MRWTLPNILTLARLVAVPVLPVMFLYFDRPWAGWYALTLFITASITDYLDGYLARACKLETLSGAPARPIPDQALFGSHSRSYTRTSRLATVWCRMARGEWRLGFLAPYTWEMRGKHMMTSRTSALYSVAWCAGAGASLGPCMTRSSLL